MNILINVCGEEWAVKLKIQNWHLQCK